MKKLILFTLASMAMTCYATFGQKPMKTVEKPATDIENIAVPNKPEHVVTSPPLMLNAAPLSMGAWQKPMAQLPEGLHIVSTRNGLPTMIEGTLPPNFAQPNAAAKTSEARAMHYVEAVANALQIAEPNAEFEVTHTETDDIGQTHTRLQQMFGGLMVYGGNIVVHEQAEKVHLLKRKLSTATVELNKEALQVSPNPFNERVDMHIESDVPSAGKAELFDLLGRTIATIPLSISTGKNTFSIETKDLQAGAYLLKVTVGTKMRTAKMMKL
jgi:Fungalysin/Thermolysin Propeptide Motif/Secretion system C-terminal sorting domain